MTGTGTNIAHVQSIVYTWRIPGRSYGYIPADQRPRQVVGLRSHTGGGAALVGLSLSLVEARTMKPRCVGVMFERLNVELMRAVRTAAGFLTTVGPGPVPYVLAAGPSVDVGASFVYNAAAEPQTARLEVFYADTVVL